MGRPPGSRDRPHAPRVDDIVHRRGLPARGAQAATEASVEADGETKAREILFRYRLLPDPRCEYLSSSVFGLTGHTPGEFFRDPFLAYTLIHPDDLPLLLQLGLDCRQHPRVLRWRHKDGGIVWTEHCYVPIRNSDGDVVAIEGLAREVTDPMAPPPPEPARPFKPMAPTGRKLAAKRPRR